MSEGSAVEVNGQADVTVDEYDAESKMFVRLSKQEKKRLKYERRKEYWKVRRVKEKQKKKESRLKVKESRLKNPEEMAEFEALRSLRKRRLEDISFSPQKVVIDASFEEHMSQKEIKSLILQIVYCYSRSRVMKNPCQVHVTNLSEKFSNEIFNMKGNTRIVEFFKFTSEDYLKIFDRSKLVYLTPESSNVLDAINPDDIYIIGGLVDRNRLKGICHEKASKQEIRTARLPIEKYLNSSTKVITVNQVFDIIALLTENADWKSILECVIPKRKCTNAQHNNKPNHDENS